MRVNGEGYTEVRVMKNKRRKMFCFSSKVTQDLFAKRLRHATIKFVLIERKVLILMMTQVWNLGL